MDLNELQSDINYAKATLQIRQMWKTNSNKTLGELQSESANYEKEIKEYFRKKDSLQANLSSGAYPEELKADFEKQIKELESKIRGYDGRIKRNEEAYKKEEKHNKSIDKSIEYYEKEVDKLQRKYDKEAAKEKNQVETKNKQKKEMDTIRDKYVK